MALGATLRRPDRRPLGSDADVKARLSEAFPDLKYIFVDHPPAVRLPGFGLRRLSALLFRTRHPHWYGHVQKPDYAVEFIFDSQRAVRSIAVTLYGRNPAHAEPHLAALAASTGWDLVYGQQVQ